MPAYQVEVTAQNAAGSSAPSRPPNPVVPLAAQPPSAPQILSTVARNDSLLVTWGLPAISGGDPLTGFRVTATAGTFSTTSSYPPTTSRGTITGLTNGTTYTVSVVATSNAGRSQPSKSSGVPAPPYLPTVPQGLQVTPTTGGLQVTWSAPVNDGGDAITGYVVTAQPEVAQPGGAWEAQGPPIVDNVTGTKDDLSVAATSFYSVSVAATNAVGTGPVAACNIFLDGTEIATQGGDNNCGGAGAPEATIGNFDGTGTTGSFDEFALYPTVLSPAQITADYDAGKG